jgi:hypothetical protein
MPEERSETVILAWKCDQCFAENFRALPGPPEIGRTIPLVCRTCDAVKRETVAQCNLIADRRRRPGPPAPPT